MEGIRAIMRALSHAAPNRVKLALGDLSQAL
jgi:hypothetical protein